MSDPRQKVFQSQFWSHDAIDTAAEVSEGELAELEELDLLQRDGDTYAEGLDDAYSTFRREY